MKIEIENQEHDLTVIETNLKKSGCHVANLYYDKKKFGIIGYRDEADKEAQVNFLTETIKSYNGDLMKAIMSISNYADFSDKSESESIQEEVKHNGKDYVICGRKLFDRNGNEVANCESIKERLSLESIKTILLSQIK